MRSTSPESRRAKRTRAARWIISGAALAFAPKCGLCVLAYLGIALGTQVEICGAAPARGNITIVIAIIGGIGAVSAAVVWKCRQSSTGTLSADR